MNHNPTKQKRVLAIDPSTKGFGFAVMEGPDQMLDWGVKSVGRADKNRACLRRVLALIERYKPDVLVTQDFAGEGARRSARVRNLMKRIERMAALKGIQCRAFSRSRIKEAFASAGAKTKHEIAIVIAQRLPELAPRLPPFRKLYMSEDPRMNIFDAVAFALTFFYFSSPGRAMLQAVENGPTPVSTESSLSEQS